MYIRTRSGGGRNKGDIPRHRANTSPNPGTSIQMVRRFRCSSGSSMSLAMGSSTSI